MKIKTTKWALLGRSQTFQKGLQIPRSHRPQGGGGGGEGEVVAGGGM